jgi:hypothetical protein
MILYWLNPSTGSLSWLKICCGYLYELYSILLSIISFVFEIKFGLLFFNSER